MLTQGGDTLKRPEMFSELENSTAHPGANLDSSGGLHLIRECYAYNIDTFLLLFSVCSKP